MTQEHKVLSTKAPDSPNKRSGEGGIGESPGQEQPSAERKEPLTPRDRLIQLRDHLKVIPAEHFDMRHWTCGTAACIGGWADKLFFAGNGAVPSRKVSETLGLTDDQGNTLFFLEDTADHVSFDSITREVAVAVLDGILETGKVDWSAALLKATEGAGGQ